MAFDLDLQEASTRNTLIWFKQFNSPTIASNSPAMEQDNGVNKNGMYVLGVF